MKPFKFFYEGWPEHFDKNKMTSGIKLLEGHPVEIGRCLGLYASQVYKQKGESVAAMIVINAYQEFRKDNPDLTMAIENEIAGRFGGIIRVDDFKPKT